MSDDIDELGHLLDCAHANGDKLRAENAMLQKERDELGHLLDCAHANGDKLRAQIPQYREALEKIAAGRRVPPMPIEIARKALVIAGGKPGD